MGRKLSGVALLLVAVLAMLVVPRVLDPGLSGSASRVPLPAPPDIGTCIDTGADQELYYSSYPAFFLPYEVVDCEQVHDLEVISTWTAVEVLAVSTIIDSDSVCWQPLSDYTGVQVDQRLGHWQPSGFNANTWSIGAPESERVGPLGWEVCVVQVSDQRGSLENLWEQTKRPSGFGTCSSIEGPQFCNSPHNLEILAWAGTVIPDDPAVVVGDGTVLPDEATLEVECQTLAAELMRRTDPTFGGQVSIELSYLETPTSALWVDEDFDGTFEETANTGTYIDATCTAQSQPGLTLTDSLLGIGDKPLPVT